MTWKVVALTLFFVFEVMGSFWTYEPDTIVLPEVEGAIARTHVNMRSPLPSTISVKSESKQEEEKQPLSVAMERHDVAQLLYAEDCALPWSVIRCDDSSNYEEQSQIKLFLASKAKK